MLQMAVCRFCLCRIDPTKVQVATYVQGTHFERRHTAPTPIGWG